MRLTEAQIKWLEVAKESDLIKAKVKKGWDYNKYKEIEGEWKQIHKKGQQKLSENWFLSAGWQ